MIIDIHHVSLLVADVDRSQAFYEHLLGLTRSDARPELGFDGAWFEIGGQQIHLIKAEPGDIADEATSRCGRDRHVAFRVDDIESLIDRLTQADIAFEKSRSGRPAVFCRDPDGNALEFIGNR